MINAAVYWTNVALEAVRRDFSVPDGQVRSSPEQPGPTQSSRALAIAHLAMHDAYFSCLAGAQPEPAGSPTWLPGLTNDPARPKNAIPETALVGAAQTALRALYRSHAQTAAFATAAAEFVPAVPMRAPDLAWGAEVANRILKDREADLLNAADGYGSSNDMYRHRADPFDPSQPLLGQFWGKCRPFVVPPQPLEKPPLPSDGAASDAFYRKEFDDVLKKGALTGHSRIGDETVQGIFWAYDGADRLGTPPRLYCQIALAILNRPPMNPRTVETSDHVRLLALVTTAMADAGIQAWYWKYVYDLWRPVVGIREADACFGPAATVAGIAHGSHTDWTPLGAPATNRGGRFTPPFPAYPSGHATFGAAAFQVIRRYLELRNLAEVQPDDKEDKVGFEFVSDEYDGHNRDADGSVRPRHVRKFKSLWQATLENSVSRVFLGVHWRFDGLTRQVKGKPAHASPLPAQPGELGKIGGVWLGREIANTLMAIGLKRH